MNKFHYLAAVAISAMTFTGCSNDEVISSSEKSQTIGFNAMANKTGRADVTTNNLERFRVFGCTMDNNTVNNHTTIFNNVTVSRIMDPLGDWKYDNTQYWAPNKDYYFVAISTNVGAPKWTYTVPESHDTNLQVGDNFKGYGTVTMDVSEIGAGNDLVYSFASRATDATLKDVSKVSFTFYHMLSRIGVKFTNGIATNGYTIKISNVKIKNIAKSGSVALGVDPANLTWNSGTEKIEIGIVVPDNNEAAQNASVETSEHKYIIPGTQELSVSFDVEVFLDKVSYSKRSLEGTIASKEYKPGVSYMLNASITADNIVPGGAKPIEFTVSSVKGWGTDEDSDITIKNE